MLIVQTSFSNRAAIARSAASDSVVPAASQTALPTRSAMAPV